MKKNFLLRYLEYAPLLFLWQVFLLLPFWMIILFCRFITFFFFLLLKNYRQISLINLSIAFCKNSKKDNIKIAKKSLTFFLLTIFELIQSNKLTPKKIKKKCIFLQETVNTIKAFDSQKGILICSGHYSSFYWNLFFLQFITDKKINMALRRLDNDLIHKKMKKNFLTNNINIIERGNSFENIRKKLQQKEVVLLLIDQNSSKGKLYIPFFNKPASTMTGSYYLQKITKCDCYFMFCHREQRNFWTMFFNMKLCFHIEKITPQNETDDKIENFFLILHQKLEEVIIQKPEEYFWLHPRWKKQKEKKYYPYRNLKV